MATEKIFFSYSRSDSAFVLKLAKDLRDAGEDVWLDQLDIKPGSRWDSSIQNALNSAHSLIVVLSPTSVASDNVMDEVSFALENGKTVIPVLIGSCTPPFRLNRLQRIDFTGDYKTGLDQLLQALSQNPGGAVKTEKIEGENQTPVPDQKGNDLERLLWEKAKGTDTITAYNHYLEEYPKGMYKADALSEINSIGEKEKQMASRRTGLESKGNLKKYSFIGVSALLIVLALWGIVKLSSGKKEHVTDKAIPVKADPPKSETSGASVPGNLNPGQESEGGIFIRYIGPEKKHGIIASAEDLNYGRNTSWAEAIDLCKNLRDGSHDDWRLPTKEQLNWIYNYNLTRNGEFAKIPFYWSATEYPDGQAWFQNFKNGKQFYGTKNQKSGVRAVRVF